MSTADNVLNTGNSVGAPVVSATPATSGDTGTYLDNAGYAAFGGVTATDPNGLVEIRTPAPHYVTPPSGTGSATVYQPHGGKWPDSGFSFKIIVVALSNLKNTSSTKYTLALPSPILSSYMIWTSQCPTIELLSNGQPVTFNRASGIGSMQTVTSLGQFDWASGIGAVDSIRFAANDTLVNNGVIVLVGI